MTPDGLLIVSHLVPPWGQMLCFGGITCLGYDKAQGGGGPAGDGDAGQSWQGQPWQEGDSLVPLRVLPVRGGTLEAAAG